MYLTFASVLGHSHGSGNPFGSKIFVVDSCLHGNDGAVSLQNNEFASPGCSLFPGVRVGGDEERVHPSLVSLGVRRLSNPLILVGLTTTHSYLLQNWDAPGGDNVCRSKAMAL